MLPAGLIDHHAALDLLLFHAVNRNAGAVADALALLLSQPAFGIAVGLTVVVALWWRAPHRVRAVTSLFLAVGLSDRVGAAVLRPGFGRMRPCYALAHDQVRWVGAAANVGSLPSLHSSNFFAIALVVALADRRLAPVCYLVTAAVALSRVYLGVHWPTDVLAGAVWGSAAAIASWWMTKPLVALGRVAETPGGVR